MTTETTMLGRAISFSQGDNPNDLFTQAEAARLLRCSVRKLERDRVTGGGVPYAKIGGRVFYRRADLVSFIQSAVRYSTSEVA